MKTRYDLSKLEALKVADLATIKFKQKMERVRVEDRKQIVLSVMWDCLRQAFAFFFDVDPREVTIDAIAPNFLYNVLDQINYENRYLFELQYEPTVKEPANDGNKEEDDQEPANDESNEPCEGDAE